MPKSKMSIDQRLIMKALPCLLLAAYLTGCGQGSNSSTSVSTDSGSVSSGSSSSGSSSSGSSSSGSSSSGSSSSGGSSSGGSSSSSVPAVPAGLTAIAGNAQATLSWSASSGATSYHVKRATVSGGPYTQVSAPTSAGYTDTSLTNGTTYYYVVSALDSAGESANAAQVGVLPTASTAANACGMQLGSSSVIFCDTFDAPAATGNRAGDLNGNVWGASRAIGDSGVNFGQSEYNQWNATTIRECDGSTPSVLPPHDIIICNGQLREATNDNNSGIFENGDVLSLSMYPKQPFDFASRTGTISFDVSNDSQGSHAAWPELWVSDTPVPDPFSHFDTWESLPANGFGVRFSSVAPAGQQGLCANGNNLSSPRWTVDSVTVVRNNVYEDSDYQGVEFGTASTPPLTLNLVDCVISPPDNSGEMNHVEVRVNQGEIDVYATDAGVVASPSTLRKIATITNANLTFTRGLVWIEDAHYNADKQTLMDNTSPSISQRQHTFVWDNVAFDGPFIGRDFAYDAPDNTTPGVNGSQNLGKFSQANQTASWSVPGLPANPNPAAVRVLFNFNGGGSPNPTVLSVNVNGNAHSVAWPYPDQLTNTWRTYAFTIPVTDLVAGTNVVQIGGDEPIVTSNVDIVLADVPGAVPALPGANDAYPGN